MNGIAGEEVVLSADFTRDAGRGVLTDVGIMDVLFRILRSPSAHRVVIVANRDLRKVQLEEVVLGSDLVDVIRRITSPSFYRILATGFDCDARRFSSFFRVDVVPLVEQLKHQEIEGALSREERDRRRAWGETPTLPLIHESP